jgi:hypothetical protein
MNRTIDPDTSDPTGHDMRNDRYDRYDSMGMLRGVAHMDEAQAEKDRNSRAWARLCGMASPIGGPSSR